MYSEIKTSVYNAQIIAEQKEAEEAAKLIEITEDEADSAVTELINNGYDYWQNFDFSKYSEDSIVLIAQKYQSQMSEFDHNFFEDALYYLEAEDIQSVTSALLSHSNDTSINAMLVDSISGDYANIAIQSIIDNINIDKFLADDAKAVFESFEAINNLTIEKLVSTLNITMDDIDYIMNAPQITSETEALFKALVGDDKDLQRETWMSFLDNNITDEELLDFVNTFEYIYGESSFLETARVVSNSIYAENDETPIFDSIINNIYDNQEIADVNMEINFNLEDGTTFATAQDLANALGKDSSLWSKIAFDGMEPQVIASVAKAYGVENFTTDFIRNNGVETTLYSKLKVQVENAYANKEISADECVDYADLAKTETAEILFANIDSLIAEYNAIDDVIDLTPQEKEMKKRDIQDYIASAFCEALIQDEITINEKMNLFKKLTDEYPSVVETFISNSEYIISGDTDEGDEVVKVVDVINNMIEDINTPEQAIEFAQLFDQMSLAGYGSGELLNYLYNNTSNKQTYIDSITRIYSLATPEQIAQLNELFPSKKLFQDPYSTGTEDEIIKELFATMIEKLPEVETVSDAENKYNIDEDFDRSIYLKDSAGLTISEILKNYSNNNLSANEALYLIVTCGYNIEEIASGFRSLSSGEEETYLPIFLDLFANVNI